MEFCELHQLDAKLVGPLKSYIQQNLDKVLPVPAVDKCDPSPAPGVRTRLAQSFYERQPESNMIP